MSNYLLGSPIVRMNCLGATRVTEQTAILSSWMAGRGGETRKKHGEARGDAIGALRPATPRLLAASSTFGGIHVLPADGEIPFLDEGDEKSFNSTFEDKKFGTLVGMHLPNEIGNPSMEFLVRGLDGAHDLLKGLGGTVCFVAGGPSGAFVAPSETSTKYLIIVAQQEFGGLIDELFNGSTSLGMDEFSQKITPQVAKCHSLGSHKFTVGTMAPTNKDYNNLLGLRVKMLTSGGRVRTFTGSPIAAAFTAMIKNFAVHAFIGIVNHVQATMISIGARSTESRFRAYPVRVKEERVSNQALDTDRFVAKEQDVFVCGTGVTESLILKGIRYVGPRRVATHSLCFRTHAESTRFLEHHQDLELMYFRILKKKSKKAMVMNYDKVLAYLSQLDPELTVHAIHTDVDTSESKRINDDNPPDK